MISVRGKQNNYFDSMKKKYDSQLDIDIRLASKGMMHVNNPPIMLIESCTYTLRTSLVEKRTEGIHVNTHCKQILSNEVIITKAEDFDGYRFQVSLEQLRSIECAKNFCDMFLTRELFVSPETLANCFCKPYHKHGAKFKMMKEDVDPYECVYLPYNEDIVEWHFIGADVLMDAFRRRLSEYFTIGNPMF